MIEAKPLPAEQRHDSLECVTSDPHERRVAAPEFLTVCDNHPVHLTCSVHCPPECGGHLVCDPCFQLGVRIGLIRPYAGAS